MIEVPSVALETSEEVLRTSALEAGRLVIEANKRVPNTYGAIRIYAALGILRAQKNGISLTQLLNEVDACKAILAPELIEARNIAHHRVNNPPKDRTHAEDINGVRGTIRNHVSLGTEAIKVIKERLEYGQTPDCHKTLDELAEMIFVGLYTVLKSSAMDNAVKEYWEASITAYKNDAGEYNTDKNKFAITLGSIWIRKFKETNEYNELMKNFQSGRSFDFDLGLVTSPSINI